MNYFQGNDAKKFTAYVRTFHGKMLRVKQSKENIRRPACILTFDVPVSAEMLKKLPAIVQAFFNGEGQQDPGDAKFLQQTCDFELAAIVKLYGANNFAKGAKPLVSKGEGKSGDRVLFRVEKFFRNADGAALMKVKICCWKDDDIWAFGSSTLETPECVMEIKPLQGDLFNGSEPAGDEAEGAEDGAGAAADGEKKPDDAKPVKAAKKAPKKKAKKK